MCHEAGAGLVSIRVQVFHLICIVLVEAGQGVSQEMLLKQGTAPSGTSNFLPVPLLLVLSWVDSPCGERGSAAAALAACPW